MPSEYSVIGSDFPWQTLRREGLICSDYMTQNRATLASLAVCERQLRTCLGITVTVNQNRDENSSQHCWSDYADEKQESSQYSKTSPAGHQ